MDDLEVEALALVKQYGFLMPAPVKALLKKVAVRLDWKILGEKLNG